MAQQHEVRGVATSIRPTALFQCDVEGMDGLQLPDATVVRYHSTDVVAFTRLRNGRVAVVLNTGGYSTATTKLRMNQTSNQYGLGFGVYQKDWEWYLVDSTGESRPFPGSAAYIELEDGKIVHSEGVKRIYP